MGKWTRRGFITAGVVAGGALIVGVAIRPGDRTDELSKYVVKDGEHLMTAWVKISPDNTVTAITPHSEMGQGVHTALGAMLAEEMDADWDKLKVLEAPAEKDYVNFVLARDYTLAGSKPPGWVFDTLNGAFLAISKSMDMQITGGSCSVRFTGTGGMQIAGAAAREMLLKAAAKTWDVPFTSLRTEKSHIYHDGSGRSAPYAEFAAAAAEIKPSLNPPLKARKDYNLMGTSLPRIDIPAKVDGTAMFSMDVALPGMKYAAVKAAPVHGARIASFDDSTTTHMPGILTVMNMGDFVAVVADSYWQAKQGMDALDITYETTGFDSLGQDGIFEEQGQALDTAKAKKMHKKGDVTKAAENAAKIIDREYQVPYLAHACMEPMNATAWVHDGKCEVWAGTQNPLGTRTAAAKTLRMDLKNVSVYNHTMGGGFGRRSNPDYTNQAVRIAEKIGQPVKVIWSREETMQHDHYRPASTSRLSAAIGDDGMPLSWDSQFVHKMDPPEASAVFYDIPNQYMRFVDSPNHVPHGPWRSVDHTQHGFFTESFIDELAHEAGLDGYAYRRKLLKDKPRHLRVLETAANTSGWGDPLPAGQARGIAITESFGTLVAEVVTVDMNGPEPRVVHVACAADAGMAVNPDGFAAQMESGIIYGLTAALYGEITIEDGATAQSNFHDYEMVRMNTAPKIDVVILTSDAPLGGAGEPGTPPISPALTNAIFAATGKRIRKLPVKNTEFGNAS